MKSENFMLKRFGASGINRDMFTDCFEGVNNMVYVSDEAMQKFAEDVESVVRQQFPDVADKMFEICQKVCQKDDLTDDEYDKMTVGEYKEAFNTFWAELGKISITTDGNIIYW